MNRTIAVVFSAVVIAAGCIYTASAFQGGGDHRGGPPPGPPHGGPGWILSPRVSTELGLTDAQREQIHGLLEAHRSVADPLHEKLQQNRQAVHELVANGQFDEARVRALVASSEPTRTDLIVAEERLTAQILSVLTPDQRTQLEQMHEEHMDKRHGPGPEGDRRPPR